MKLKNFLLLNNNLFNYLSCKDALQRSISCILAIFLAQILRLENPYWAAISTFLVMQIDMGSSLKKSFERITATMLGSVSAVIFVAAFSNYSIILLLNIFVFVAVVMSYSFRNDSYVACLSSITLIMVTFSVLANPPALIQTAFFRFSEISVGIFAQTIVGLAFLKMHNIEIIRSMERDTINKVFEFIYGGGEARKKTADNSSYQNILEKIIQLKDAKSSFKYEQILLEDKLENINGLESKMIILLSFIDTYDPEHKMKSRSTKSIFSKMQNNLQLLLDKSVTLHEYNKKIEELLQVKSNSENDFIKKLLLILYFNNNSNETNTRRSLVNSKNEFVEMTYLKQGIKAAIAALSVPIIWILFDLPGLSQIGVSALILTKIDLDAANSAAKDRMLGCILGVFLGFITLGFDITNFALYLFILFVNIFGISLLYYSQGKNNYFSLQMVIGYIVTAVTGCTYTTNINTGFNRVIGIIFGIISAQLSNRFIWPVTQKDLFKLEAEKISEEISNFSSNINIVGQNITENNLASCLVHIHKIKISHLDDLNKENICKNAQQKCIDSYNELLKNIYSTSLFPE